MPKLVMGVHVVATEPYRKEISVHLLAYNLVRWAMATAAKLADVLPRTLGFTGAKRVLSAFVDELRRRLKASRYTQVPVTHPVTPEEWLRHP